MDRYHVILGGYLMAHQLIQLDRYQVIQALPHRKFYRIHHQVINGEHHYVIHDTSLRNSFMGYIITSIGNSWDTSPGNPWDTSTAN